jgi:hypothetical protein
MANKYLRTTFRITLAAFALTLVTAAPARADWLFSPWAGLSFGGETRNKHLTFGGSIGWMGAGIVGVEVDGGFAPDLLDGDNDVDFNDSNSSVTSLMGNVILGAPMGRPGVRPYVSGGVGLLRTRVSSVADAFELTENSFGLNIGGGIMAFLNDHAGIRADVRYLRRLQDGDGGDGIDIDLGRFDFWRASVGGVFRF